MGQDTVYTELRLINKLYGAGIKKLDILKLAVSLLFSSLISHAVTAKTVVLDQVSDLEFHKQTRALVIAAHKAIGNEVTFVEVPLARSYQEIQKGKLSGLVCRVQHVGDTIENVVRIPESVGSFDLVLVIDSLQCPDCNSLNDLHHVVSVQGFVALQGYLEAQTNPPENISYLATREKVLEMLERQRVDGIIVSDVLLPIELLKQNPHWKVVPLKTENLFHYLHSENVHMVEPLSREIKRLKALN